MLLWGIYRQCLCGGEHCSVLETHHSWLHPCHPDSPVHHRSGRTPERSESCCRSEAHSFRRASNSPSRPSGPDTVQLHHTPHSSQCTSSHEHTETALRGPDEHTKINISSKLLNYRCKLQLRLYLTKYYLTVGIL